MRQVAHKLVHLIDNSVSKIDENSIQALSELINNKDQAIFITGAGRSQLVGRFFAMRLMHLGKQAYIVGGLCTPSIQAGDVLIAISGSGQTASTLNISQKAKILGAYLVVISTDKDSALMQLADVELLVTVDHHVRFSHYAPMGTIFETSALVFLESFIGSYMLEHGIPEDALKDRHANLE